MLTGAWTARLVHTAAELGIADHLADGPRGVDFLAAQIGAHTESLARLLRALTAIGVLHESKERSYGLTPLGRIGLDLMLAILAPHDQPHTGRGCVAERHRRARHRFLAPLSARRVVSAWPSLAVAHIASAAEATARAPPPA